MKTIWIKPIDLENSKVKCLLRNNKTIYIDIGNFPRDAEFNKWIQFTKQT